ncbi:MAG: hypothetical protein K4305_09065 [Chlorobium sp.]|uniref:hypothetical protein n=1 Tax=Chlorobium sp. TaxID=1095 RepID=UPI002F3FD5D9
MTWLAKLGLAVKVALDAAGPFLMSILKLLIGQKQRDAEAEHGVEVVDAPKKHETAHQGALKRLKR